MTNGFGSFLSNYRKKNHLTQSALAEILDISDATLAAFERGIRKPSYNMLIRILNILKVSADEALGLDSYVNYEKTVSILSHQLERLDEKHKMYAVNSIKLIIESFAYESDEVDSVDST